MTNQEYLIVNNTDFYVVSIRINPAGDIEFVEKTFPNHLNLVFDHEFYAQNMIDKTRYINNSDIFDVIKIKLDDYGNIVADIPFPHVAVEILDYRNQGSLDRESDYTLYDEQRNLYYETDYFVGE